MDPNNPDAPPKPLPNDTPNPNGDENGIPLSNPSDPLKARAVGKPLGGGLAGGGL